jgi:hypothetical protein
MTMSAPTDETAGGPIVNPTIHSTTKQHQKKTIYGKYQ